MKNMLTIDKIEDLKLFCLMESRVHYNPYREELITRFLYRDGKVLIDNTYDVDNFGSWL